MKKSIFFMIMLMVSAFLLFYFPASAQVNTGADDITIGEAFRWCFTQTSYVVCLIVSIALTLFSCYMLYRDTQKNGWSGGSNIVVGVLIFIMLAAIFYIPCDTAANTTNEMAGRGVYIR